MVERKEEVGGNWYLPEVKAITWAPPQASWETGSEHGRREGWWKSSWGRCSSSSLPVPSCPSVPAPQLHIFCTCFSWLSFCSIISDQWSLASDSLSLLCSALLFWLFKLWTLIEREGENTWRSSMPTAPRCSVSSSNHAPPPSLSTFCLVLFLFPNDDVPLTLKKLKPIQTLRPNWFDFFFFGI